MLFSSISLFATEENNFKDVILFPNSWFEKGKVLKRETKLENANLKILYFNHKRGSNLDIRNSTIVGLNMQGMHVESFKVKDTTFLNARINGTVFKECELTNVKFINSDLSFSNINKCKIKNTTFKNSVKYGLSNY